MTVSAKKLLLRCLSVAVGLSLLATSGFAQVTLTDAQKKIIDGALAGNPQAQSEVGMMFYTGTALPKADIQAAKWFQMSADQGDPEGEYNLGLMYLNGRGVPQSNESAVKWLTASALKGESEAQFMLGLINSSGLDGAEGNQPVSVAWLEIAAQQGNEKAEDFLAIMTPELSSEALMSADDVKKGLHEKIEAALKDHPELAQKQPPIP